jgi:hypothetical protein
MADKPKRAVPTFDERTELELDHLAADRRPRIILQRAAQPWDARRPARSIKRAARDLSRSRTPKGKPPPQP